MLDQSNQTTNQESEQEHDKVEESDPEVDEIVQSMSRELERYAALSARQAEPKPFIIHKLHPRVKSVDESSYHPTVVSLGPYHLGTESLGGSQNEKFKCLDSLLKESRGERKVDELLAALQKEERLTRNVYSEDLDDMDGESFLKMMLLDSCYLLGQIYASESKMLAPSPKGKEKTGMGSGDSEMNLLTPLLQKGGEEHENSTESAEPVQFYRPWCTPYVARDLLLLENQIPFFAVEKIYESLEGEFTASALREKTTSFVKKLIHPYLKKSPQDDIYNIKPTEFHHLLHLCHMYFKPIQNHKEFDFEKVQGSNDFLRHLTRWRRATQYEQVGIKVKCKKYDKNAPHSLLDVTLKNDVIEIPFLPIDGNTVSLFRNMVALESKCALDMETISRLM